MAKYQTDSPCTSCGKRTYGGNCFHHIKTRGSGGSDEKENLMPLCFSCHTEVHKIGLLSFSERYKSVEYFLIANDWFKCPLTNKWKNNKMGVL